MEAKIKRWRWPSAKDIHFDIDVYLDHFVPPNPIRHFPKPIARFLGYRDVPAPEIGNILVALWAMLGAFLGLLVVAAAFKFSDHLQIYNPPVLFASLGATAILDYLTITSPLAQPRAALLGHTLSALVGVAVAKLFMLSPSFLALRWIAGPVACAVASFVMALTNTIHPPGGATAVLATVDPRVAAMGWMFIPFILLGSILMFSVAILINNVQRQFPVFWWTKESVGGFWRKEKMVDVEVLVTDGKVAEAMGFEQMILLTKERVMLPERFVLSAAESRVLQNLRGRLEEWKDGEEDSVLPTGDSTFVYGSETTHIERSAFGS